MLEEAVDTCLTPSRQNLRELQELADSGEGVLVGAWTGTFPLKQILDENTMSHFLVRHVLEEESFLRTDANLFELLVGEAGEAIVEQVKFDPLLVECEILAEACLSRYSM